MKLFPKSKWKVTAVLLPVPCLVTLLQTKHLSFLLKPEGGALRKIKSKVREVLAECTNETIHCSVICASKQCKEPKCPRPQISKLLEAFSWHRSWQVSSHQICCRIFELSCSLVAFLCRLAYPGSRSWGVTHPENHTDSRKLTGLLCPGGWTPLPRLET